MIISRGFVRFYAKSVTIGDFDGLHLGHQAVLSRLEPPSCVVTFRQNTKVVLGKRPNTPSILPFKIFVRLLADLGINYLCILNFKCIRSWSAQKFMRNIVEYLNPRFVFLGETAKIGCDRVGTKNLQKLLKPKADLVPVKEVCIDGEKISSTKLRLHVSSGDLDEFRKMTGRRYTTLVKRTSQGLFFKPHLLPQTGFFETDKGFITLENGHVVDARLSIENERKFEVVEFTKRISYLSVENLIARSENI